MYSKNKLTHLRSLHQKKNRILHKEFLVEGWNDVEEVLKSNLPVEEIWIVESYFKKYQKLIEAKKIEVSVVAEEVIQSASSLKNNHSAIAVMKFFEQFDFQFSNNTLVLDKINDPGNLGTIIRTADWFGIENIICSEDSVDLYNSKTISASKGAFLRAKVHYCNLTELFQKHKNILVLGAYMNGLPLSKVQINEPIFILMGNEAQGISKELEGFVTEKITIQGKGKTESLNVGVATSIILYELNRSC